MFVHYIPGCVLTDIVNEVPVLSANNGGINSPTVPAQFEIMQPVYPPLHTATFPPMPNVVPPPGPGMVPPAWPAITDLVVGRDGRYQQSDQTPEIQACLKAAVRRANGNLVFLDGFPEALHKARWLGDALVTELIERRKGSITVVAVDDRARSDQQYFNQLLHMVMYFIGVDEMHQHLNASPQIGHRWSTFQQGVIDTMRALITSPESSYGVGMSKNLNQVETAENLLSKDAYHFGKTAVVSTQTSNRIPPSEPQSYSLPTRALLTPPLHTNTQRCSQHLRTISKAVTQLA